MISWKKIFIALCVSVTLLVAFAAVDTLFPKWVYYPFLLICYIASILLVSYNPKEKPKTHYWVYYIIRNAGGNGLQPCLGTLRSQSGKFVFTQDMLKDFKNVVSFSVIEVDKGSYDRVDTLISKINKQTKDEDIHINTDNRTGSSSPRPCWKEKVTRPYHRWTFPIIPMQAMPNTWDVTFPHCWIATR